jgi:hypothetical protein
VGVIQQILIVGASAGFIILFVGSSSLYMLYQRRKLLKLKEKFFKQNGGFILLRQLSKREDASGTAQIFKEDELKKLPTIMRRI